MIDDPHKIDEGTSSAAARESVIGWFDSTISTRRNHPGQGGIVVIGQRLHERDLFGHLLAQGDWIHLCLPAEYDPTHPFLWPGDRRTEPGQPLWPARYDSAEIARIKRSLGSQNAAALNHQENSQVHELGHCEPGFGRLKIRTWPSFSLCNDCSGNTQHKSRP